MSFGKRYSRDDFAHIFENQFRHAPEGWRDFMAAVFFANNCRYGGTPKTSGHICWPGDDGETPAYPVRWVSKRLKAKLLKSWKIFHDGIPLAWKENDSAHDRLWACAGYQAVGAGIGLDDFAYEMRISEEDINAIETAFKAADFGYLEHISCFNGVID